MLAALGAGLAAGQAILGVAQGIKGLTMPKPSIPDYEIPQEIYDNMTDAEYWSFIGMPEEQKKLYMDQIAQQGATALSRSADRKGGLGMISTIADQQRKGAQEMAAMDASMRAERQKDLYAARTAMGQQRAMKYEADRSKAEYLRGKRDEMIGAGIQNIGGALGSAANMASAGVFDKLGSRTGSFGGFKRKSFDQETVDAGASYFNSRING
jgi:hypothetical protein